MENFENESPATLQGVPGSLRPRRFGVWLAPTAVIVAAFTVLAVSRLHRKLSDTAPPVLPPNPALLSAYSEAPTGWAGDPVPFYEGDGNIYHRLVNYDVGIFAHNQTDFFIGDVIPINFTRTYLSTDSYSRSFGIGTSNSFDMFLIGDNAPFTYVEIVTPSGQRYYYQRISPGIGYSNAVYKEAGSPDSAFFGSTIKWNGWCWDLWLRDGMLIRFPSSRWAKRSEQAAMVSMQDAQGHLLTISRDNEGNILKIVSPNGASLKFVHDKQDRITHGVDSLGHTIDYEYDAAGRLILVHDSKEGDTRYTYDARNNMLTAKMPDGSLAISNQYDANDHITRMGWNGGWKSLSYTCDKKKRITSTVMLDSRGYLDRYTFGPNQEVLSHQQTYVGSEGSGRKPEL